MAGRLLLIRHGETALNVARVLQPAATPLSQRGVAQAAALARRLATMDVRAIIGSDLPRALATAEAIAAATGAPLETTPLLRERDFGAWRGRAYDTLPVDPLTLAEAPPNGESAAAFGGRVAAAFAHVVARHAVLGGTLAVVTHGLVIRALLGGHLSLGDELLAAPRLGNTGLTIVDAQAPHGVELLDCTLHLDDSLRDDAQALSGG